MAPRLRRAALRRFALTLTLVSASVLLLVAFWAPALVLPSMQLRLATGLLGCCLGLGALLVGLPKKKRSRVTTPRTLSEVAL